MRTRIHGGTAVAGGDPSKRPSSESILILYRAETNIEGLPTREELMYRERCSHRERETDRTVYALDYDAGNGGGRGTGGAAGAGGGGGCRE